MKVAFVLKSLFLKPMIIESESSVSCLFVDFPYHVNAHVSLSYFQRKIRTWPCQFILKHSCDYNYNII